MCMLRIDEQAIKLRFRNPYIQILALGMKGDKPRLIPLQRLEGARHVLLLNGSIVGYGTLLGDDTYPLLTDWRTCATVRLIPALYNNNPHMLRGRQGSQFKHRGWVTSNLFKPNCLNKSK